MLSKIGLGSLPLGKKKAEKRDLLKGLSIPFGVRVGWLSRQGLFFVSRKYDGGGMGFVGAR